MSDTSGSEVRSQIIFHPQIETPVFGLVEKGSGKKIRYPQIFHNMCKTSMTRSQIVVVDALFFPSQLVGRVQSSFAAVSLKHEVVH